MKPEERKDTTNSDKPPLPASPYGPQPYGTDEAAGGADSSPYETLSSDEKEKLAQQKAKNRRSDDTDRR